jgi:hypothetical protein
MKRMTSMCGFWRSRTCVGTLPFGWVGSRSGMRSGFCMLATEAQVAGSIGGWGGEVKREGGYPAMAQ